MKKWLCIGALVALLPSSAIAQSKIATAIGPRVGISTDPDQLVLGGQLDLGEIAPDLTFTPNIELGFGDDITTIQMNGDFHWHFAVQGSPWRPYVGGGIGVAHYNVDLGPFGDFSTTEVGANLIGGAIVPTQSGSRFFVEVKFGLGDLPDLKALVGWNFKL
jgi:opacity protein-like surface antigen